MLYLSFSEWILLFFIDVFLLYYTNFLCLGYDWIIICTGTGIAPIPMEVIKDKIILYPWG